MKFEETVLRSWPTGSRHICYPPVTNTDNDTVILVNGFHDWQKMLMDDGWEACGDYQFGGEFTAFRKGEENYIVTENPDFFNRYVFATEGAKALNLTNKDDRIKLFQAIGDSGEGYVGLQVGEGNLNKPRVQVAPGYDQFAAMEQLLPEQMAPFGDAPWNHPARGVFNNLVHRIMHNDERVVVLGDFDPGIEPF